MSLWRDFRVQEALESKRENNKIQIGYSLTEKCNLPKKKFNHNIFINSKMDYFKGQTKNIFGDVQDFFSTRLNGLGTDIQERKRYFQQLFSYIFVKL